VKSIYADFNDLAADGTLPLTCAGSVESIRMLSEPLTPGETVLLTDGELSALATVSLRLDGAWEATADWTF
jgi:hypothetical protein